MTKFYEKVSGSIVRLWEMKEEFDKTELEDEVADLDNILNLGDEEKELLLQSSSFATIEQFDDAYTEQKDQAQEIIDYYDHDVLPVARDEIQDAWVSPAAIYDKCGEEVTRLAIHSIDGILSTFWKHEEDHAHSITLDMGIEKKLSKIRIWVEGVGDEFLLEGVDVAVGNVQVVDNASFNVKDIWNEVAFTSAKNGRYVYLTNINTPAATGYIRVREIELFSEVLF